MHEFCFATITSKGYTDQTAGLFLNLQDVHPGIPLVAGTIDSYSTNAFRDLENGPTPVSAQEMWGEQHWQNMKIRMTRAETAYASKSALAVWILQNYAKSVLILDSDLLFLEPIDDIVQEVQKHDATLTAARHPLQSWRKTNRVGLFSAGLIGFSQGGLPGALWWKGECFNETRVLPIGNVYNEQKYLDYLVGFYSTFIIRDWGINVSATILRSVNPQCDETGRWVASSGEAIRVFHQSRVTQHPIVERKEAYNRKGDQLLFPNKRETVKQKAQGGSSRKFSLVKWLRVGHLVEKFPLLIEALSRRLFELRQIVSQSEVGLISGYRHTYGIKRRLADDIRVRIEK